MQILYNRAKLVGLGIVVITIGIVISVSAVTGLQHENRVARLIIELIGPSGARILYLLTALLSAFIGLRLWWLAAIGGQAVSIEPSGIRVHKLIAGGFLRWSEIAGITCEDSFLWSEKPVVVINRRGLTSGWHWLLGLGPRISLSPILLRSDPMSIRLWVGRTADIRRRPRRRYNANPGARHMGFGRRS